MPLFGWWDLFFIDEIKRQTPFGWWILEADVHLVGSMLMNFWMKVYWLVYCVIWKICLSCLVNALKSQSKKKNVLFQNDNKSIVLWPVWFTVATKSDWEPLLHLQSWSWNRTASMEKGDAFVQNRQLMHSVLHWLKGLLIILLNWIHKRPDSGY